MMFRSASEFSCTGKSARIDRYARVAELVDALDLGSSAFGREGSSPSVRTLVNYFPINTYQGVPGQDIATIGTGPPA